MSNSPSDADSKAHKSSQSSVKQNEKIKVILYAPLGVVGGIASWTESVLASSLNEEYEFVLLNYAKHWQKITDKSLNWRTIYEAIARFWRLQLIIKQHNPAVFYGVAVLGKGMLRDILLARLAILNGLPVLLHVRSGNWGWLGSISHFLKPLIRWLARDISFVTLSKNIPLEAAWFFSTQPHVLPNFIGRSKYQIAQKNCAIALNKFFDRPVLLFIGWLSKEKGVFDLLEVAKLLPECDFVVVGPSTDCDLAMLVNKAKLLGVSNSVKFEGAVQYRELSQRFAEADLFVMLSYTEGFPNVVLEAMAHGRPVVATGVGAISEMLGADTDKPAGYVIKVGDVNAAADRIRTLLSDKKLYEEFSTSAKIRCESLYSEEVFVSNISHLLIESLRTKWLK